MAPVVSTSMDCPVCDVTLSISSREGVEIDFCPQCRGVWLDRGELDKIIDRAATSFAPAGDAGARVPGDDRAARHDTRRDDRDDDRRPYDERSYRRKKRRSFLDDIFDFD